MEVLRNWITIFLLVLGVTAVVALTFLAARPALRERQLRDGLRGAADVLGATVPDVGFRETQPSARS